MSNLSTTQVPLLNCLIQADNGTAANPTISFFNAPTNGFYLQDSGTIALSIGGTKVASWNSTGPVVVGTIELANGTAAAPSLSFANDATTGLYLVAAGQLGVSANGVQGALIDNQNGDNRWQFVAALNKSARQYLSLNASSTAGASYAINQVTSGQKWSHGFDIVNTSNAFAIAATDGFATASAIYFQLSTAGAVTLGAASGTQSHSVNGNISVTGNVSSSGAVSTPAYDTASPANTNTVTASANKPGALLTPAGGIAGITFKLPSSPIDGQQYWVACSQIITTVTWQDAGGTAANVIGGPATIGGTTNTSVRFVYNLSGTKWYRI